MGLNQGFGLPPAPVMQAATSSSEIFGFDISQYQGSINFSDLASASSFVVIRVDYGAPSAGQTAAQYQDANYVQNREGAEAQGMEIGLYHYAYPEYDSADAEAACFCENVGHLNPGEFVVLDFEESYSGDVVGWVDEWLDDVYATLGVRPLLYINLSTEQAYDWSSVIDGNYGLWLAYWDYNPTAAAPSTQWPFVAMRQYSDEETASGISGDVDGDVFYGSLSQLEKYGAGPPVLSHFYAGASSLYGGQGMGVVVQISSPADSGGNTVEIQSSSPDVQIPSVVTIPGGKKGYSFPITTSGVASPESVTLTATMGPSSLKTTLTLEPCALKDFYVSPTTINAGSRTAAVVQVVGDAPTGGTAISLVSGSPAVQVPSTVTIPAGTWGYSFPITTSGDAAGTVTLVAKLGSVSLATTLTLRPVLTNFSVSPSTLMWGDTTGGTVQLGGPAGQGGVTISLRSGSSYVQLPASVTVPEGKSEYQFPITTTGPAQGKVTLVATEGSITKAAYITLSG